MRFDLYVRTAYNDQPSIPNSYSEDYPEKSCTCVPMYDLTV